MFRGSDPPIPDAYALSANGGHSFCCDEHPPRLDRRESMKLIVAITVVHCIRVAGYMAAFLSKLVFLQSLLQVPIVAHIYNIGVDLFR